MGTLKIGMVMVIQQAKKGNTILIRGIKKATQIQILYPPIHQKYGLMRMTLIGMVIIVIGIRAMMMTMIVLEMVGSIQILSNYLGIRIVTGIM